MPASYGDIRAWTESKDPAHVPSFDSVCKLVGIPAYLEIGRYGLCEDCGYGHVDRDEYTSSENESILVLVQCIDDLAVRCMRCAAAHFGDPSSAQVEKP
ncbi:MAG TPA: hypothetical protein VHX65_02070 [Pirellulales bacterium]|jgi:C4-type Zn-finger protein|nr:hypothetical protein [Pirellulales bacterium]